MATNYKLVAIDVDGTLLNSRQQLTPRTAEALQAALDKGVHIVLATGKMYVGIQELVGKFGLQSPQITSGGAVITQKGQEICRWSVARPLAEQVIQMCEEQGLTLIVLRDGLTFAAALNDDTNYMETYGDPHPIVVNPLVNCLEPEPTNLYMIAYQQDERFGEAVRLFEQTMGGQLSVKRSSPYFLEFVHRDASKGNALRVLAERLDIAPGDMVAIGDSHNDLSMFAYVGRAVAMGSSSAAIQQAAHEVTASNDEDGVAQAIERLILA